MEIYMAEKKRIHMLDEIRGFAIICMIFHHALLDVGDVLGMQWGYSAFNALCVVQPIFWAIFIVISGICSRLSRNTARRGLIVFCCALAVTLVTAVIMPFMGFERTEIYFGILHFLGLCMIITGLLMPIIKKINYKIGALICLILFIFFYGIETRTLCFGLIKLPSVLYQSDYTALLGLHTESFFSADYFPLLPWIFIFLFGAFLGKPVSENKLPETMYVKRSRFLSAVGKNSLWVYLAHQPVIYGIMLLISLFIK